MLRAQWCQDQSQESDSRLGWVAHKPGDPEKLPSLRTKWNDDTHLVNLTGNCKAQMR